MTPREEKCANCGHPVPEAFCGACGQRRATRLVSLRRLATDVLDEQFLVSSALPRTLGGLLFRPGFLTREYVAGRIVRYVAPFRLYLGASLLFFLVLTLLADPAELGARAERCAPTERDRVGTTLELCAPAAGTATRRAPEKFVQLGPLGDTLRAPEWWKPAARRLAAQEERINGMTRGQVVNGVVAGLERNAPTAVFLLLPLYAAFLKVLYARRGRLYVEHFVFALHIHAFTLLVLTVLLLAPGTLAPLLLVLWLPAYTFVAMRRVYGQGVMKTAVKFVLLGTSYVLAFLAGLLFTAMVAALTL